jgi:hypothetical protein
VFLIEVTDLDGLIGELAQCLAKFLLPFFLSGPGRDELLKELFQAYALVPVLIYAHILANGIKQADLDRGKKVERFGCFGDLSRRHLTAQKNSEVVFPSLELFGEYKRVGFLLE